MTFGKIGRIVADIKPRGTVYRKLTVDQVLRLPIGTVIMVRIRKLDRPYMVVRWGKRRLKRLRHMPHLDCYFDLPEKYLPIRQLDGITFRIDERRINGKGKRKR